MRTVPSRQEERIESLYPLVRTIVSLHTASRDQREEWTQEAFVEILRGLKALRRPEALGSWAATITRRTCYRMIRSNRQPPTVTLQEGMVFSRGADPGSLSEDLREAVRHTLASIAGRYRRALTLYYVNDRSVAEVADTLGTAEGTVKRWLHEGRALLRKELVNMPETQELRSEVTRKPFSHFMWWGHGCQPGTVGHNRCWPWTLFDSLLAQQILFSARKEPKSLDEICQDVGAERPYVQDMVGALVQNELMVEEDTGFITGLFFLDKDDQKRLHEMLLEYGRASAEIVAERLPDVRSRCKPDLLWGKDTEWENVLWVVIPVFLCNLAVSGQTRFVSSDIEPPVRPDGSRYYLFAWEGPYSMAEGGWKRNFGIRWITGCNIFSGSKSGFFWTSQVRRAFTFQGFNLYVLQATYGAEPVPVDQVRAAAQKAMGEQKLDFEDDLTRLLEFKLVEKQGNAVAPTFPVFTAPFWREAGPLFTEIGQQVASQALDSVASSLESVFDELGFQQLREQYPVAKACVLCAALHHTLEELHRRGELPDPPGKVEPNWGFWGSEIPCPLLTG